MTEEKNRESADLNIYDNAMGFVNAYHYLSQILFLGNIDNESSYTIGSLIMPTLVNGIFACELFIKALLKKDIRTHSLVKLFEKLQKKDPYKANMVENTCITILKEKNGRKDYEESQFLSDLNTYDVAFEKLRYWHERDTKHERIGKAYNSLFIETLIEVLKSQCQDIYGERPLKSIKIE